MKPDYPKKTLSKLNKMLYYKRRHIITFKTKLDSKDDENAKFDEQCTEKCKNPPDSCYSSENAKEKQHCTDYIEIVHCKSFTSAKSNIRTCF